MLVHTGISESEERVYRALVSVPSAALSELAARAGLRQAELRSALHTLEAKGLVSRTSGRRPRYLAAPPEVAIEPLVLEQLLRLEQARATAARLQEEYRAARRARTAGELVEVVSGYEAIAQRFEQLQSGARSEVMAFVKPPFLAEGDYRNTQREQLGRAIRYRTVYDHDGFEAQGTLDDMAVDLATGEEARVAARLPMKLFMVDRSLAFVPLTGGGDEMAPGAVLVHESGLLDALMALFEGVWERATPLSLATDDPAPGSVLTSDDHRLLSLLQAGLTDDSIARHLGTSVRTVHRRIRRLMTHANADTRFGLGASAKELGWI